MFILNMVIFLSVTNNGILLVYLSKKNKFSQSIKIYLNKTVWNQEYEKNETKFLVQCKQVINNALITTLIQVSAHLNHIYKWTFLITRCSTSLCSSVRLSLFKLSHFYFFSRTIYWAKLSTKRNFWIVQIKG